MGAVTRSTIARPGRAAATADGTRILYEQNGAAAAADIVSGPLAGPDTVIDTANTQDGTCWRDTDLVAVAGRVLARYCPPGTTAWRLRSIAGDGSSVDPVRAEQYQAIRIDGSGAATRFVFLAAVRDARLVTGWSYELTLRPLDGSAPDLALVRGGEDFWLDPGQGVLVSSFGGTDGVAGIWVYRFDRAQALAAADPPAETTPLTGRRWAGAPDDD